MDPIQGPGMTDESKYISFDKQPKTTDLNYAPNEEINYNMAATTVYTRDVKSENQKPLSQFIVSEQEDTAQSSSEIYPTTSPRQKPEESAQIPNTMNNMPNHSSTIDPSFLEEIKSEYKLHSNDSQALAQLSTLVQATMPNQQAFSSNILISRNPTDLIDESDTTSSLGKSNIFSERSTHHNPENSEMLVEDDSTHIEDKGMGSDKEIAANISDIAISNAQDSDSDSDIDSEISSNESDSDSSDVSDTGEDINMDDLGIDSEEEGDTGIMEIPKTKNEILNPEVPTVEFDSVPQDTVIYPIGQVHSTIDRTVVIKGVVSGEQKVLDYGSILVLDDYTILGAVFDTFGPVRCPLYSVIFKNPEDIDRTKISIGRKVFVAELKSKYVLTSSLNAKGSDASNLNDEEISESDIEFSDDEQEMKFKKWMKNQRNANRSNNRNAFSKLQGTRGGKNNRNNNRTRNASAANRLGNQTQVPQDQRIGQAQLPFGLETEKKLVHYGDAEFDPDLGF